MNIDTNVTLSQGTNITVNENNREIIEHTKRADIETNELYYRARYYEAIYYGNLCPYQMNFNALTLEGTNNESFFREVLYTSQVEIV